MIKQNSPLVLGTEPTGELLTQYAIPVIIAVTASPLHNIADSTFISRRVGALAISGLVLTFPLMNLAAAFDSLMGVGASTLAAVKLGQKDYERANKVLGNVLILNVVLGVTFTTAFLFLLDPVLYFFGVSENTISHARDYMRIILYGNVVTHMYLGSNAVLRSSGFPRMAMYATLVSVVINCALNPLFIFGFGWGIKGSVWATVISQVISLTGQLIYFSRPKQLLHFKKGIYKLRSEIVEGILSIGSSPFLMNLCSCLTVILISRGLKEHGEDMAIGAYGIMNRIVFLFMMTIMGFNQGMQPIAGYNYGARLYSRVTDMIRLIVCWAVGVTTPGLLLHQLAPSWIVRMFTSDGELISAASYGLHVAFAVFPIVSFQMAVTNFFLSIGMSKKATFLSLTRQTLFLIPCLIILPPLFGTLGVWTSMSIADAVAAIVTAVVLVK